MRRLGQFPEITRKKKCPRKGTPAKAGAFWRLGKKQKMLHGGVQIQWAWNWYRAFWGDGLGPVRGQKFVREKEKRSMKVTMKAKAAGNIQYTVHSGLAVSGYTKAGSVTSGELVTFFGRGTSGGQMWLHRL